MARTRTTAQLRTTSARVSRKAAAAKTGSVAHAVVKKTHPDAIWRRYRLLIVHADMDPAPIAEILGLHSTGGHKAGELRFTPKGTPLPGRWTDTRWSAGLDDFDDHEVEAAIRSFLDRLEVHSAFWRSLAASDGEAHLICSLDGTYQGLSIEPELLRRLADLNIRLGIEIYAVDQKS